MKLLNFNFWNVFIYFVALIFAIPIVLIFLSLFDGFNENFEDIFEDIRELGQEYGATTGRPRQINWLDFDLLKMASRINGVNKLVINKMDILDELDVWKVYNGRHMLEFESRNDIEFWIKTKLMLEVDEEIETFFSGDKEYI